MSQENLPTTTPENLPVNPAELSDEEFLNFYKGNSGSQEGGIGFNLPVLRVNYSDYDEGNNKIPRGQFCITINGQTLFAEEVEVRIVRTALQYSHYSDTENKFINRSTIENDWNGEFLDEKGGTRCGKIPSKMLDQLSDAEREYQKELKVSRLVFGFLTMTGVDSSGEMQDIENQPFMLYAKGTNFMPVTESIQNNIDRKGYVPAQVQWKWTLDVQRSDTVTFWVIKPQVLHSNNSPYGKDVKEFFANVHLAILAENEMIKEKWASQQKKKLSKSDVATVSAIEGKSSDDQDLNDEIPFG